MSAETIALALNGRRAGSGYSACCPAHDDRKPSLSINDGEDGRVLVKCFAGCSQEAVIDALKRLGLWGTSAHLSASRPNLAPSVSERRNTERAERIWNEAVPISGSGGETYLRGRGLQLPLTSTLRYHPALTHSPGNIFPAMVARVTNGVSGHPMGIHRTFLCRDGSRKARVNPAKKMLGPCAGGAVQLAQPTDCLMIGEGIETVLSAMQATGLPGWAALSTSGLRSLGLPDHVRNIIILADHDKAGLEAANDASVRWMSSGGKQVRIAKPPKGMDFNDLLMQGLPFEVEGDQ